MFDFNDSLQVVPLEEEIPRERIVLTHQSHNYLEVALPEKGEYIIYAAATVDAHGNSSFLSAQYAVFLDSLMQPKIVNLEIVVTPPSHTGKKTNTINSGGDLIILEGSFVKWKVLFNKWSSYICSS